MMSSGTYVVFLLFSSFALAVWIDSRWPRLTPTELRGTIIHVGASLVALQILVSAGLRIGQGSSSMMLVTIVTFIVPALVYCLIAGIWVMKLAQGAISHYRH
jgi:hypothetical protein